MSRTQILRNNLPAILLIAGGYFFLVFSAYHNPDHHYTLCLFKNITGYSCPGCGLGRSSIELFKGNLWGSLHFHWLGIPFQILVLIALVWLIRDIIKGENSFWKTVLRPMNSWLTAILLLLILVSWIRAIYLNI